MARVYQSLFFTYYSWAKALALDPYPQYSALGVMSLLEYLNIGSMGALLTKVGGVYVPPWVTSWPMMGLLWALVFVGNYLALLRGNKFPRLVEEWDQQVKSRKGFWNLIAGLVIAGTAGGFFTLLSCC